MDDFAKQASSYQLDQEILDARGINMTVEEVAGLPTCKYSERVHSLHLSEDDLVFLKGLRRRIKNRVLNERSDPTTVPDLEPERLISESHSMSDTMSSSPSLPASPPPQDLEKDIFECRIEKLVQQSVNHIYKEKKRVTAKTVFLEETRVYPSGKDIDEGEVLNLSLKRRSHGRKQTAPRRIAYVYNDTDDGVLDLKIKKENP